MQKINKLLSSAKYEARLNAEQRKHKDLVGAMGRMTMDQLLELVYGDPADNRVREIFVSVGGLHPLESG